MSTDGCSVWSDVDDYLYRGRCLAEDPSDSQIVFAGGALYSASQYQAALTISFDGGNTWPTDVTLGSLGDYSTGCSSIAVAATNPLVIYAGGEENRYIKVWKSVDGGSTWTDSTNNLDALHSSNDCVNAVWVAPDDENFILVGTDDAVCVSSDGGATWADTAHVTPTLALAYYSAYDTLYAATSSQGVFKTEDRGVTWQAVNTGLGSLNTSCLAIDDKNGYLYAGTTKASCWRLALEPAPLWVDFHQVSAATGGSSKFYLNALPTHANRKYLMVGGVTGFDPGYGLPGGLATIPVNFDVFTYYVVFPLMNTQLFANFLGVLDNTGRSEAKLNAPPLDPMYAGLRMYYAYCLGWPWEYASNHVEVVVSP